MVAAGGALQLRGNVQRAFVATLTDREGCGVVAGASVAAQRAGRRASTLPTQTTCHSATRQSDISTI